MQKHCTCCSDLAKSEQQLNTTWALFHEWYNIQHFPNNPNNKKRKRTKDEMYHNLRSVARKRYKLKKIITNHTRYNTFCDIFYQHCQVSPTFLKYRILSYM